MKAIDRYDSLLQWYTVTGNLDFGLMKRQMLRESQGEPRACSKAGAIGLFQFMPKTWQEWGEGDPTNPEASIRAGCRYMAYLLRHFSGDYGKALAAYNWGMGHVGQAVQKLGGMWRTALPAETSAYLRHILQEGEGH